MERFLSRKPATLGEALSQGNTEPSQALAWWDWDHPTLHRALPDFRSLSAEAFLQRYGPLKLQRAG